MVKDKKDIREVSWFKVLAVCFYFIFLVQIYMMMQLFIFHFYLEDFTPTNIILNLIFFGGALFIFLDLLPKDYIYKKEVRRKYDI